MPPRPKDQDPELHRWTQAFGAALRARRRELGFGGALNFYEVVGIGPSKIERGEGNVTLRTLVRMCAGLKWDLGEFLDATQVEVLGNSGVFGCV